MKIRRLILNEVGPFDRLDLDLPAGDETDGKAEVHLLVGPNGTGKSSVLAALAQCFSVEEVGLVGRMRSPMSAAVVGGDNWGVALQFASASLDWSAISTRPEVSWASGDAGERIGPYQWRCNYRGFHNLLGLMAYDLVNLRILRVEEAGLFAYGGLRSTDYAPLKGYEDQTDNPLFAAAVFHRPGGPKAVAQWVYNNCTQHAYFEQQRDLARAAERRGALRRLERAIAIVLDVPEDTVRFSIDFDPADVRLSMGDAPPCPMRLLPDGLQSLLSWLGDLLMRLDRIPWKTPGPVTDRPFVLLLDEVEVHMHPAWQRRVLPMVENLFPNAQIIASTHSPFVIGSATDAWIHPFRLEGGRAVVEEPVPSALGTSVAAIVNHVMGVPEEFDVDSEGKLKEFRDLLHRRLAGDAAVEAELDAVSDILCERSRELRDIVGAELRRMRRQLGGSEAAR